MESLTDEEFSKKWSSVMMADRQRRAKGLKSLPDVAEIMAEGNRRSKWQLDGSGRLSVEECARRERERDKLSREEGKCPPGGCGRCGCGGFCQLSKVKQSVVMHSQIVSSIHHTPTHLISAMAKLPSDASYLSVERREFYADKLAKMPVDVGVPVWLINEIKSEVKQILSVATPGRGIYFDQVTESVPEWQRAALESQRRADDSRNEEATYTKGERIKRGTW